MHGRHINKHPLALAVRLLSKFCSTWRSSNGYGAAGLNHDVYEQVNENLLKKTDLTKDCHMS